MRIKKTLIGETEIKEKIAEAGRKITEEYRGKPLILVGILKGSFVFLADLCRAIDIPSGELEWTLELNRDISGYHVIIAEDIIDSGITLQLTAKKLAEKNPLSLKIVTLLDKPDRRQVDFKADTTLFTIPDAFVVGYGLDCAEKYRNLPYIAELEENESK